jgi:hypothetical protein
MKAWQGMKLFVGIRLFGRAILKVLCPYLKRQERVIIQLVAQRNIKTIELGSLFPGFRLVSVDMPVGGLTEVGRDHFSSQNLPVTIRVTTEPLPPRLSAEMAKNGFKRVLFPIIYLTQDEVIWRQTGAAFFALSQTKETELPVPTVEAISTKPGKRIQANVLSLSPTSIVWVEPLSC